MQIMPTDEGEVGSVATVRFQTSPPARSIVTRPKARREYGRAAARARGRRGPAQLHRLQSRQRRGHRRDARRAHPRGLKHPAGAELEYNVGDLKPGESRQLQLHLKAVQAGTINNVVTAKADANLRAEHRFSFEVASAKLDVALTGPKRRYLEREATYQFSVANPGTAPAKQVELVAYLPPGLKFVSANNAGRYDANTRAVFWQMDELPVNQHGTVELVTMPVAAGQFNLKVRGVAQRGVGDEKEQPCSWKGWPRSSSSFRTPKIRWKSAARRPTRSRSSTRGQRPRPTCNWPFSAPELKPLAAEGPTRYTIQDDKVVFESLPQLAPNPWPPSACVPRESARATCGSVAN